MNSASRLAPGRVTNRQDAIGRREAGSAYKLIFQRLGVRLKRAELKTFNRHIAEYSSLRASLRKWSNLLTTPTERQNSRSIEFTKFTGWLWRTQQPKQRARRFYLA